MDETFVASMHETKELKPEVKTELPAQLKEGIKSHEMLVSSSSQSEIQTQLNKHIRAVSDVKEEGHVNPEQAYQGQTVPIGPQK